MDHLLIGRGPSRIRLPLRLLRLGSYGAVAVSSVTAGCIYLSDEGLWRTLTVLASLIPMAVDYHVLSFRVRHLSEELQRPHFLKYHEKWAEEPLRVCLKLKGFYVKMGQVLSGQVRHEARTFSFPSFCSLSFYLSSLSH
jgi:hypothetical protein